MLENELVKKLIQNNYKIATAESCTGGLLASTIIGVADASKVLDVSFVTYAVSAKEKFCGVNPETVEKFDVVSENVAREMAIGVKETSKANVGVGITGLAGPAGGTPEIRVGTVCFGISINDAVYSYTNIFDGSRNEVREKAVNFAIQKLLELL